MQKKFRKLDPSIHQHVAQEGGVGGYEREQSPIEVTFTCIVCGKMHTRQQYPGAIPSVCPADPDGTPSECQLNADRERLRRWREQNREEVNRKQREYRARKKLQG